MPRQSSMASFPRLGIALALTAFAASSGCSRGDDTAAPLATPTVTVLRPQAPAGRTVDVTYRFAVSPSAPPFAENYTVFVHALDEDGDRLWTGDHEPPTPTSQWKPGTVIEYTQPMAVPRRARAGRVTIAVGIYSPRSRDRLPLSGDDMGRRAYRVGTLEVTPNTSAQTTIYLRGWYDLEAPEGPQGAQWRWTKDKGTVWLRRPAASGVLVVAVDQPTEAFDTPQQVTVLNGDTVLDTFPLPRGRMERRRVPLPPPSGPGDDVRLELTVAVDKTFVPARIAAMQNKDTRELGVRVFEIHIEED
jgi:hypothetical protein